MCVFAVGQTTEGLAVTRKFPPHPRVLAAPDSPFRSWPKNPLPAGVTTLPPPGATPFEIRCDGAATAEALLLVASSPAAFEEPAIEATLQELRQATDGHVLAQDIADRCTKLLAAKGWAASSTWLRLP